MDLLETSTSAILAVVGTIVGIGGLFGTFGRMSQSARARRRVSQAAALAKEAHPSVSGKFSTLHKEESALFLAVVEARIGRATGWTAIAAAVALTAATIVVMSTYMNASEPHIWSDTWPTLLAFGSACLAFTLLALNQASARHRVIIQAYRAHIGPRNTKVSAPEDNLHALTVRSDATTVNGALVVVTAVFTTLFVVVAGHVLGREFTDAGRLMKETDPWWFAAGPIAALLALFIAAGITGTLLFPKLPRSGESLQLATEAAASQRKKSDALKESVAISQKEGEAKGPSANKESAGGSSVKTPDASDVSPSTPQGPPGS